MEVDIASITPYLNMAQKTGFMWGSVLTCAVFLVAMIVFRALDARERNKESLEFERKNEKIRMRMVCYEVLGEMRERDARGSEDQHRPPLA